MGGGRVVAGLWVVLACAAARGADATYEFKQNYQPGEEFVALTSQSVQTSVEIHAAGQVLERLRMTDAHQTKARFTVLEVRDGKPVSERVTFDRSSGSVIQHSGEAPRQVNSKLAGKTVTVTQEPFGGIRCDVDGVDDPRTTRLLRQWFDRDTDLYPNHPVRLKEKWDLSKQMAQQVRVSADQQLVCVCRLVAVKQIDGRSTAVVSISAGIMGTMERIIHLECQVEGQALVDLDSGRVIRVDAAGDLHASGSGDFTTRDGRVVNVSALGDGRVEIHELCVPASQVVHKVHNPTPGAAASAK